MFFLITFLVLFYSFFWYLLIRFENKLKLLFVSDIFCSFLILFYTVFTCFPECLKIVIKLLSLSGMILLVLFLFSFWYILSNTFWNYIKIIVRFWYFFTPFFSSCFPERLKMVLKLLYLSGMIKSVQLYFFGTIKYSKVLEYNNERLSAISRYIFRSYIKLVENIVCL